ncbi:unnamed protein product, partial [Rotaria sp. Silwood1]
LPQTHPDLAITYSNIGKIYFILQDYYHALSYYKMTYDIQLLSNPWECLAKLMLTIGEFDKAEKIYENILENISSNDYQQLAFIYHQLGCVRN